jgi:hypothetical protein
VYLASSPLILKVRNLTNQKVIETAGVQIFGSNYFGSNFLNIEPVLKTFLQYYYPTYVPTW